MTQNALDREHLEHRLQALQNELGNGQRMLAELEAKRGSVTHTMLRIEGAIELLRELLATIPVASSASAEGRLELVAGAAKDARS